MFFYNSDVYPLECSLYVLYADRALLELNEEEMCHKIIFNYNDQDRQVSFDNPNAKLPIALRNGKITLLPWGRRQHIASKLPLGGCLQLDEIYQGKWDEFFPKAVKLPLKAFLVRDLEDQAKWFHLPRGKWIQGLVASFKNEKRVYIVTLEPNTESIYPRWPRILLG